MSVRRTYGQFCALAGALDLIGERWTLLIVRELLIGPARFGDLEDNLPGIGPNLLSSRLRMLVDTDLVAIEPVPGDGRGRRYRLTELGESLREPVLSLARWGLNMMAHDPSATRATVTASSWGFLAVQALIDQDAVSDVDETYEFRVGPDSFHIEVRSGRIHTRQGPAEAPVLVVTTSPETFIRIGARLLSPFDAVAARQVVIDGSLEAMQRCTRLLGLAPDAAGARGLVERV